MGATSPSGDHSSSYDPENENNTGLQTADMANPALFDQALAAAGIAIGYMDSTGRILSANDSLSKLLGEPIGALLGRPLANYLMSDWQTTIHTRIAIGQADPTPARYVCQLKRMDDGQPWAALTLIPLTDSPVEGALFQVVLQDMTWQRHAIYPHQNAATRYRDLFEATTDPIAVEHNNRILDVNPAFEQLFGYTQDEAIGKQQLAYIAPEAHFKVRQHLQSHHNQPMETIALDKMGNRFPVEVQGKVIDYQGESVIYVTIRDLREKKAAERAIREKDQLYRILAGNLPNSAVCLFDPDMRILLTEGDLLSIKGDMVPHALSQAWKGSEGKFLYEAFSSEHDFIEQCQYTLTGQATQQEYRFSKQIILIDTLPVHAEDGSIRMGMALARDVTESRIAAEQLAASEGRVRALLNALPDTLFVLSNDDVLTTYQSGDDPLLLGDDGSVADNTIQTVGLPERVVNEILTYRELALETHRTQAFECRLELDGEVQHFDARMVSISDDEVLTLFRNITHLKRIQEELAEHLEEMTLLRQVDEEFTQNLGLLYVMSMGLDTVLRQSGGHAGFIVRFKDPDSLEIDPENFYVAGGYQIDGIQDELSKRSSLVARAIREQKPVMRHYDKDGSDRLKNHQAMLQDTSAQIVVPLYSMNEQRRLLGLVNLESNRTDRFTEERYAFVKLVGTRLASTLDNASLHKQTEEQLEELRVLYEKVTRLEQLKTDMIRIASHDLKNPLAGLTGHLEMLRWDLEGTATESTQVRLNKMRDAMRKMQDITTGILSLERIEQMAQNSTDKVFNLSELVRRTANEHEDEAKEKKQVFIPQISGTPLYINGDALQLHEAISNLIGNAIKYTPKKGSVSVYLERGESQINFKVVDTGYGVPEAQQKRLFEPFFRAKTEETANIEGTGLGLHLVKNIIERHGGEMIFESVYNQGSTFGFRLPLVDAPPNAGRDDIDNMRSMMVG